MIIELGRLTRDIEVRYTQKGKAVGNFGLAVRKYNGESKFHECIVWEKQAEIMASHLSKGDMIQVIGELDYNTYEKDGVNIKKAEIIVNRFEFTGKKTEKSGTPTTEVDKAQDIPSMDFEEDDLPF